MITKSEQQETDRAGKRLFREMLERLGWVLNDVQEDYGIDSNVQVFDNGHPTGAWFHVQLKSSRHSDYSADHSFLSQGLSADHARHYALEMRQPVAIVHVDVLTGRVYWIFPQLERNLVSAIKDSTTKSVALRIPTAQELPQTAPDLLLGLEKVYLTLASRELTSASVQSFAESLKHLPDQNALAHAFQVKSDTLKLQKIRDLYREGKLAEARSRAEILVADPDSIVEVKFWAEIQLMAVDYHEIVHTGKPQNELPKAVLKHAKALQDLTRLGPKHLKFYALISRHAADLEIMVHENSSLFMAFQQHLETGGNPMMALGLYARRSALAARITKKYNRCVRLARYATNSRHRWFLGRALTNVVNAIARYIATLSYEGNREVASAFAQSALQFCKLAVWISTETDDTDAVIMAIISALTTVHQEDSDAYRWAKSVAQSLRDPKARADAVEHVERAKKRWRGDKVEGDYHGDTIWQIIQNIATGLGLDISDENSPLVRELRIAAKDNTPDRVLVNCEHLLVAPGAIGPAAREIKRFFGISTAGSKVVHCTLHDYHTEERDLDSAYSEFRRQHCDSCGDARPRPVGWRYDNKARLIEQVRHSDFVARFAGKRYGARYTDHD
jgi:hypothetical protein